MKELRLAAAALLLATAGCWHAIGPGISGCIDLATPGRDTLRLVYLGTGGWIMEHRDAMVLAAPLFTNPSLLRTGLAPIASDTAQVDEQLSRYDVSRARAILVGHAHYDHLMDVPRVAKVHAPDARIVGSRTVANTLGTWSGLADRVDIVNDSVADHASPGRWLWYGDDVRVLPLRSHHAPHFEGYTLYVGTREAPLTAAPRWASEWVEGRTFAFLVDFMASPDSVAFRVYYQDAVVAPPGGFAPDALIAERPVDVAILVPATFDQVDWHPEAFIENLRPRRVLLGHWENFFKSVDEPARSVALTDMEHFEGRLSASFEGEWWRPDRWTEFLFPGG